MKTKNFILNTSSGRGSLVCLVLMLVLVLLCPSDGSCQILGNSYTWQDTIVISGTAIDSLYTVKWESISMWADSVDWYIIVGASARGVDTTSWSSRIPTLINAGDIFVIDDGKKLRRAKFWTRSGTGTMNVLGEKKTSQY